MRTFANSQLYAIQKGAIYALPILHYTMECAMHVKRLIEELKPDCIAVELPQNIEPLARHAASRLPDISVIQIDNLYLMCEPCEPTFEALRSAIERDIPAFCIDVDVHDYPLHHDLLPDPYSIFHIGLKSYYEAYIRSNSSALKSPLDLERERAMAQKLTALSTHYSTILFVGGMSHIQAVLEQFSVNSVERDLFNHTVFQTSPRNTLRLATLTEDSCREVMAEYGWVSMAYETWRSNNAGEFLDRQKLLYALYKNAAEQYHHETGHLFLPSHMRNLMKFSRNYALIKQRLLPNLFEILTAARGCVDSNYAYETWLLATSYPYRKNCDNLEEMHLSVEEVWGSSKLVRFNLKQKRRKGGEFCRRPKDRLHIKFQPPSLYSICSYPPEDAIIENFADFLKKKGRVVLSDANSRVLPFSTSLEEGIEIRETIRHFYQKKLYVKVKGPPPGEAGSVVVIFDEDSVEESGLFFQERYPWKTTWHGEHTQESDMSFYASPLNLNVVGPGISRCEYGGLMMSYPPRRLIDIWNDPDYFECHTKAEVLLMAAIDYAVKPIVVFVSAQPPHKRVKHFANRFGKKIVHIPIGHISPTMVNKLRIFHVLEGHDKREWAGDYIF